MSPTASDTAMKRRSFLELASLGALGLGIAPQAGAEHSPRPAGAVKTILSFATETAHAAEDFDFIKAIAEFLTEEKLVGNFHLTGDYARALKRRGRQDVVQALARHEIGFHCNHHGSRPFMAGYLEKCPWDEGLARWLSNESPGFAVVAELFNRRPTYYTTEFSRAPQTIYGSALMGAGIIGYLPVPMRGHSAVWFSNGLVPSVENAVSLESFHAPGDRERLASARLDQGLARQAAAGKDVLRVFLHSYKYYAAEPYDRLTMTGEVYKTDNLGYEDFPTDFARRTPERFRESFEMFKRVIRRHAPHSRFVTFSQYRDEFRPNGGVWLGLAQVDALCRSLRHALDAYSTDTLSVSPAEAFGVVVRVLRSRFENGHFPERVFVRNLIGPRAPVPAGLPDRTLRIGSLGSFLAGIDRELDETMALPSTVALAGASFGPGQLLRGLAQLYLAMRAEGVANDIVLDGDNLPQIANEPFFQETGFTRKGLYPDDFTGQNICAVCRAQSWSWKPAVRLRSEGAKSS